MTDNCQFIDRALIYIFEHLKAIITVFLSLITVTCIIFEFSPKKIKEFIAIRLGFHQNRGFLVRTGDTLPLRKNRSQKISISQRRREYMSQYSDDVEVDETSEPAPDGLDPLAWYV